MDIDAFIEARKRSGLSQTELVEGICTQVTLSRFENNGQVPSLKILILLCDKLNLSVADLFPKVEIEYSKEIECMNQVEFNLITSEYEEARELLQSLSTDDIEATPLMLRYLYLKGFLMIFEESPLTEILFVFDQVMLNESSSDDPIYSLLAYTGIGMAYARDLDMGKADYYFSKVMEKIYVHPVKHVEDAWRVLNIVFHTGVFYASCGELEVSNALLEYALTICSNNHVTYYSARAAFQLAQNKKQVTKQQVTYWKCYMMLGPMQSLTETIYY